MRLVLDQGLPRDAAALLRERGHDCIHIGDIGMSKATDEETVAWSLEQNAIVVTLPPFTQSSLYPGHAHPQ